MTSATNSNVDKIYLELTRGGYFRMEGTVTLVRIQILFTYYQEGSPFSCNSNNSVTVFSYILFCSSLETASLYPRLSWNVLHSPG